MRFKANPLLQRFGVGVALLTLLTMAPLAYAADQPFTVTSNVNSATPFNVTLPSTLSNGKPVKTVVIQFITADCNAPVGTTYIGSAFIKVIFSGNVPSYTVPFQPGMPFVNQVEFSSAQSTEIFADPGSTLSYGLSAATPTCTVAFSGHLIPQ
jgi:hypothetical protein